MIAKGEVPHWALSSAGAHVAVRSVIPPLGTMPLQITSGSVIVFEGDSNMAGSRVAGPASSFPSLIAAHPDMDFILCNKAFGGARAVDWPGQPPVKAALFVIMLGTNDAAPRGLLSFRRTVSQSSYETALGHLIALRMTTGAQVLVLAPPPTGSDAMDRRIRPYRLAARRAAATQGAAFADTAEAFATPAGGQAPMQYDGLHFSAHGQKMMANWLVTKFQTVVATSTHASEGRACK